MQYRFARPADKGDSSRLRAVLIAQLQRVGSSGKLHETIDFLTVGFFTSRFATHLQRFSERLGRRPDFVFKIGFEADIESRSAAAAACDSTVAALARNTHAEGALSQSRLSVWPQGFVVSVSPAASGGYDISRMARKVARWKRRNNANGIIFELVLYKTGSVAALLDNDGLYLVDDEKRSVSRLCWQNDHSTAVSDASQHENRDTWMYTVLFTGTWIAYEEGWLCGKP